MNIKIISSITLASLMLCTGIPNLTAFADDSNNISSQNISLNAAKEENFTEKLIIDNQEYEYDYKLEGDNHTIQIKGENENSNK